MPCLSEFFVFALERSGKEKGLQRFHCKPLIAMFWLLDLGSNQGPTD